MLCEIDSCYTRHGGAYDRGSADAWYGRPFRPHYFTGDTYMSQEILIEEGCPAYEAYKLGYESTEFCGKFKD